MLTLWLKVPNQVFETTLCNVFRTLYVSCDDTCLSKVSITHLICLKDAAFPNEGLELLLVYVRMAEGSKVLLTSC